MDTDVRVPVTIVTGFLGSGKTSLLNHLLTQDHGRRLAVLVNDFGAVNIDADLVRGKSGDVVSLENGCICCNLSDGLVMSTVKVLRTQPPPEHIVIETSGVADPLEVARAFSDPDLQPYAPLDGIITVVDTQQLGSLGGEARALCERQLRAADVVLLNKVDIAPPGQIDASRVAVRALSAHARMHETERAAIDPDLVLGFGGSVIDPYELARHHAAEGPHGAHAEPPFESFLLETSGAVPMQALETMLRQVPNTVWRIKGFVHLAERPDDQLLLQVTPRRAEITIEGPWGERTPGTSIVLIGERGRVDWARLVAPVVEAGQRPALCGG